jgi:hypothetical protein
VIVQRFAATLLLALLVNPAGGPATLQHLDPQTLEPTGSKLHVLSYNELAVSDGRVAVWTRGAVRVVDTRALRYVATHGLRRRDVCTVGLDGATPVALVGCAARSSVSFALIRFGDLGRTTVPLRARIALPTWPASFAFGDGQLFVARGSGQVDAIDAATGAVRVHPPPARALAKAGVPYVQAAWLGDHQLGLNGAVVDVRTWHRRTIAPHATRVDGDGPWLTTYGHAGVAVWTRDLRLYRRFLRGQYVDQAKSVDGVLYARVALVWHRFDIRTGRSIGQVVPDESWQMLLL